MMIEKLDKLPGGHTIQNVTLKNVAHTLGAAINTESDTNIIDLTVENQVSADEFGAVQIFILDKVSTSNYHMGTFNGITAKNVVAPKAAAVKLSIASDVSTFDCPVISNINVIDSSVQQGSIYVDKGTCLTATSVTVTNSKAYEGYVAYYNNDAYTTALPLNSLSGVTVTGSSASKFGVNKFAEIEARGGVYIDMRGIDTVVSSLPLNSTCQLSSYLPTFSNFNFQSGNTGGVGTGLFYASRSKQLSSCTAAQLCSSCSFAGNTATGYGPAMASYAQTLSFGAPTPAGLKSTNVPAFVASDHLFYVFDAFGTRVKGAAERVQLFSTANATVWNQISNVETCKPQCASYESTSSEIKVKDLILAAAPGSSLHLETFTSPITTTVTVEFKINNCAVGKGYSEIFQTCITVSCNAGEYLSNPGTLTAECVSCPMGTYSNDPFSTACSDCPANSDTYGKLGSVGLTDCRCRGGYVGEPSSLVLGSRVCHKCDGNAMTCGGGPTAVLNEGFYKVVNSWQTSECGRSEVCFAQTIGYVSSSTCSLGYEGPNCGSCVQNYMRSLSDGQCEACSSNKKGEKAGVIIASLIVLCIIVGLDVLQSAHEFAAIKYKKDEVEVKPVEAILDEDGNPVRRASVVLEEALSDKAGASLSSDLVIANATEAEVIEGGKPVTMSTSTNYFRAIVGYVQILTLFSEDTQPFAATIVEMFNVTRLLSFDFFFDYLTSLDCSIGETFHMKMAMAMISPLTVIIGVPIALFVLFLPFKFKYGFNEFVRGSLITILTLYPMVVKLLLTAFNSEEIGGIEYVKADTGVRFNSSSHNRWKGGIGIFLVLFALGFPVGLGSLLYFKRKALREHDEDATKMLGFFVYGMKTRYSMWEAISVTYRLLAVTAAVFAPTVLLKALFITLITTVMLVLVVHHKPGRCTEMNNLNAFMLFSVIVTGVSVALVYSKDNSGYQVSDRRKETASTMFLLTNFVVIASLIFIGVQIVMEAAKAVFGKKETEESPENGHEEVSGDKI